MNYVYLLLMKMVSPTVNIHAARLTQPTIYTMQTVYVIKIMSQESKLILILTVILPALIQ